VGGGGVWGCVAVIGFPAVPGATDYVVDGVPAGVGDAWCAGRLPLCSVAVWDRDSLPIDGVTIRAVGRGGVSGPPSRTITIR